MVRSSLREEVRCNIKRTVDGVANSRINTWLNWAQNYISDLHTYEEMRKRYTALTVNKQKSYGFPTKMKDIYSLTVQDGGSSVKLVYVNPRKFDVDVPRIEELTTDVPDRYVDYGVNFDLCRIPNGAYTLNLRCSSFPLDFSGDDVESELLRKDALICAVTTVFGLMALSEVENAAYWGSQVVPSLFEASLKGDHSAEDWKPVARGFGGSTGSGVSGEWWRSPFTGRRR